MLAMPSRDDERPLKTGRVPQYARDMVNGTWELNGDAIQFDYNGVRLNGKHRLHAIVASGISVPMLVMWGLQPDAFRTIDRGVPRSFADTLQLANTGRVVAVTRLWFLYERTGMAQNLVASDAELRDIIERHPEVVDAGQWIARSFIRGWPMTQMGFTRAYTIRNRPQETERFWDGVVNGDNLPKFDPRLVLRNQFTQAAASNRVRFNRAHALAITIKSWNAFITGNRPKVLKWLATEGFPQIIV